MSEGTGLEPKTVIEGRFELVARLHDHGRGEVWKARDPNFTTRLSMLKFLRGTEGGGASSDALRGVVDRLRELRHANLLQTTGVGVWEGVPYVAQGWFEGSSLTAALDAACAGDREVSLGSLTKLIDQVCAALEALHGAAPPMAHGGLHPGCVLAHRTPNGDFDVRVIDAGLAPFTDGGTASIYADCVAPERKNRVFSHPTLDVYALAKVMRTALREPSEKRPHVVPFADHRGRRDVPAAVWEVMARATLPDPAERYETAAAMRVALRAAWRTTARLEARRPGASDPKQAPKPTPSLPLTPSSLVSGAPPVLITLPRPVTLPPGGSLPGEVPAQPAGENPWSTSVLQREVSVQAAFERPPEQGQEPAGENPWSTSVLHATAHVDEEVFPTVAMAVPGTGGDDPPTLQQMPKSGVAPSAPQGEDPLTGMPMVRLLPPAQVFVGEPSAAPAPSSRSTVMVAGVVVLLLCVTLGVLMLVK